MLDQYSMVLFDLNIVCTSDINKDSILSYAILHCGLNKELIDNYKDYPTLEIMQKELVDKNIGYNLILRNSNAKAMIKINKNIKFVEFVKSKL